MKMLFFEFISLKCFFLVQIIYYGPTLKLKININVQTDVIIKILHIRDSYTNRYEFGSDTNGD